MFNNSTKAPSISHISCSNAVSVAFTGTLFILSAVAFIGNIIVIATFVKISNLRTSTNYYLVNMAVSDVISACIIWPLFATEGMLNGDGLISGLLAVPICKLGMSLRVVSQAVSILSLVLVAVDRYLAIAYPLKAPFFTARKRPYVLLLTWLSASALGAPYMLYSKIVIVQHQTFCRFVWSKIGVTIFYGTIFVTLYVATLITLVVLYLLIMRALRKKSTLMNLQSRVREQRQKQNNNVLRIFVSLVCGFFICWTPLCVYGALKQLYPSLFLQDKCMLLVGLFYYVFPSVNMAINPVILFCFGSKYRQAIKQLSSQALRRSCCTPRNAPRKEKKLETTQTTKSN